MLKEPSEFSAALSALFAAQEQAIQAGSAAGGEHLCFIGKDDWEYASGSTVKLKLCSGPRGNTNTVETTGQNYVPSSPRLTKTL